MTHSTKFSKTAFLRVSIGIVFIWFGTLKFFPGVSPAESLAINTIQTMTIGFLSAKAAIILLALLEVGIGLMLMFKKFYKVAIMLAGAHIICTFLPLLFFPSLSFSDAPMGLTLLGQYIIKNLIIISALYVIFPFKENMIRNL